MCKNTGKIYIHKNNIEKRVDKDVLNYFLKEDWVLGRVPFSKNHCNSISFGKKGKSNKNKGKIAIYKDNNKKCISIDRLDNFVKEGWSRDMPQFRRDSCARIGENNGRFNDHRTYEELHGVEKANTLKKDRSLLTKGKTYEELYGIEKAKSVKVKRRVHALDRIEKNYGTRYANYNKKACEFFKWFDEQNNTRGRYAMYGDGEFRIKLYYLDYINFENKLIIEWDEEHHYKENNLLEKDIMRQKEIELLLPGFKIIRIREKNFINDIKCCNYTSILNIILNRIGENTI